MLEYMTNTRYAREMITEGVMVMMAATRKWKAECVVVGSVESAWIKVVYDAMMIGGRGGNSG